MHRIVVLFLIFIYSFSAFAAPNNYFRGLNVDNNSAVVVFDVDNGRELYSNGKTRSLKPASVLKLLTTVTALEEFGPYYRFKTEVLGTGLAGSHVEKLYVKGYGDPSLTQEDLWLLARKVYLRGVRSIGRLVVDDSYFIDVKPREGVRAYEAGGSALSLNFNSITFDVCPISGRKHALVTHDPREMPVKLDGAITTSNSRGTFQIDELKGRQAELPLHFKLKGNISKRSGCQEIYRSVPDPAIYLGAVLKGLLNREGVDVRGGISRGGA